MASLLLLIFSLGASSQSLDCHFENICQLYAASGEKRLPDRHSNGRTFLGGPNYPAGQEPYICGKEDAACERKRARRIDVLFKEAKERLTKVLAKNRSTTLLTRVEKKMVERLKATTLLPASHKTCKDICVRGMAAALIRNQNAVCLCPTLIRYSDEFVLFTMAHELTHAMDPCALERIKFASRSQHPFHLVTAGGSLSQCLRKVGIEDTQPSCLFRSVLHEATVDALAYEALADLLQQYPLADDHPADRLGRVFGPTLKMACKHKDTKEATGYAEYTSRLRSVAFSIPSLREALGCKNNPTGHDCDYRFPQRQPSQEATSPAVR